MNPLNNKELDRFYSVKQYTMLAADFVSICREICFIVIFSLIIVHICDILPCMSAKSSVEKQYSDLRGHAKIDDIDLQIIKLLNKDGRTPFAQIAKQLGVSTGMIRQRYQRLVQEGVLQIVAITNPLLMGFATMAQIGVKADVNRLEEIAEEIAAFDEVVYLVIVTGSYDLHVEVICRDNTHLLNFLTKKLHAVDGVKEGETFMYLRIAKENYGWAGFMNDE